jgi:hypothetical protein
LGVKQNGGSKNGGAHEECPVRFGSVPR